MVSLYRSHQTQSLCDCHELPYTPQDPPWRMSMTEVCMETLIELSIRPFGNIYWVIDTLVARLFLLEYANLCRTLQTISNHFRQLQTASNHFNQPLQTTSGPKCSVHQALQASSTYFKELFGVIHGPIIVYISWWLVGVSCVWASSVLLAYSFVLEGLVGSVCLQRSFVKTCDPQVIAGIYNGVT